MTSSLCLVDREKPDISEETSRDNAAALNALEEEPLKDAVQKRLNARDWSEIELNMRAND